MNARVRIPFAYDGDDETDAPIILGGASMWPIRLTSRTPSLAPTSSAYVYDMLSPAEAHLDRAQARRQSRRMARRRPHGLGSQSPKGISAFDLSSEVHSAGLLDHAHLCHAPGKNRAMIFCVVAKDLSIISAHAPVGLRQGDEQPRLKACVCFSPHPTFTSGTVVHCALPADHRTTNCHS